MDFGLGFFNQDLKSFYLGHFLCMHYIISFPDSGGDQISNIVQKYDYMAGWCFYMVVSRMPLWYSCYYKDIPHGFYTFILCVLLRSKWFTLHSVNM